MLNSIIVEFIHKLFSARKYNSWHFLHRFALCTGPQSAGNSRVVMNLISKTVQAFGTDIKLLITHGFNPRNNIIIKNNGTPAILLHCIFSKHFVYS